LKAIFDTFLDSFNELSFLRQSITAVLPLLSNPRTNTVGFSLLLCPIAAPIISETVVITMFKTSLIRHTPRPTTALAFPTLVINFDRTICDVTNNLLILIVEFLRQFRLDNSGVYHN